MRFDIYSGPVSWVVSLVTFANTAPSDNRAYVCKWCGREPHGGRCHAQRAVERERQRAHGRKR